MDDPISHCLAGNSLLLTGLPGTGKTHLARSIVLREQGEAVHLVSSCLAAPMGATSCPGLASKWILELLHVAVLRVEAPRRVRRRSEGARVLHRLHAPVGEVLVLELVGVVLEDPELRGRLLLHVLGRRAPSRGAARCRPRPPAQSGLHCPPLRATLVARSFFSVWMPRSTTAMALRSSGRFVRCTASGSSRSSVANSLPRSVVTTKFPSSPVSSRAARLVARPTVSAFLFCRGSTAASRAKTSITTRPYFVFPRVFWLKSACSRSLGPSAADLPSARGWGACTCRPTSASAPRRPWPASRRGRAASQVGTASARPAR